MAVKRAGLIVGVPASAVRLRASSPAGTFSAASTALNRFVGDIAALKTACAVG